MPDHQNGGKAQELTPLFAAYQVDLAVGQLLAASFADCRLLPADYALYSDIAVNDWTTATTLARRFSMPLTTMSDWIATLLERGHVERARRSDDHRSFGLHLTEAGLEAHREAAVAFDTAYRAFLRNCAIPPEKLLEVLGAMIDAARAGLAELKDQRPG